MTNDTKEAITKYMAFYPSFREAIDMLTDDSKRLAAYDMLTNYGLYGIEPDQNTEADLLLIFTMGKPNIKKFATDLSNGCKGGRPKKDNKKNPVKTADKTPVKTKKEKEKEIEKEKESDNSFSYLSLNEGEMISPSADAGESFSPFTFSECQECATKGKVNISEDGINAFYNRMKKDGWKIKGEPVNNLLMAMRGFVKNHKMYQKTEKEVKTIYPFKAWLQQHGYDKEYVSGRGDFESVISVEADSIRLIFDSEDSNEPMEKINNRLLNHGYSREDIKPIMLLFKKWLKDKNNDSV